MNDMGKLLEVVGLLISTVGALRCSGIVRGWLGHLPGDIHYSRGNFSLHFPIITCLVLSLLLTLVLWFLRR